MNIIITVPVTLWWQTKQAIVVVYNDVMNDTYQRSIDGMNKVIERLSSPGYAPGQRGEFLHAHDGANVCRRRGNLTNRERDEKNGRTRAATSLFTWSLTTVKLVSRENL